MLHKKIAIDARMINHSGIGTYLQNILPIIVNQLTNYEITLLGNVDILKDYAWATDRNVSFVDFDAPIYSIQEQIQYKRSIPNTDLLWIPHYNIPILYSGKLLVTVHDISHLVMPSYVWGWHKHIYANFMFKLITVKANSIITVSNFTKEEMKRHLKLDESKIQVVHNGVNDSWFNVRRQVKFHDKPYILYVGNVKPHKNLVRLLQAFSLNIMRNKRPYDLLIVGKKEGFITGDTRVFDVARSLNNRVYFTGCVTGELLKQIMVNADALVFPSLYEGFGLPPLEAMACGCPALVSNTTSLPEVCGDAVLYCDPTSIEDIARQIDILLNQEDLRVDLRNKGKIRAVKFSWEKCAEETIRIIESLI